MKLTADIGKRLLLSGWYKWPISNSVRSFKGGGRRASEVVRTIPGNLPYDPQPFPKGLWKITGVEWQSDAGFDAKTYGPVKIKTDAWQQVKVWELDEEGDYLRETAGEAEDGAYWLHYSAYMTTLGCIRIESREDASAVATLVSAALKNGEEVLLEVV